VNFFQILTALFYNKKSLKEELDTESLQLFHPYLINRWLSFYDNTKAVFVNETLNKFVALFEDKSDMFKLYYNLIPQTRFKKISYIKKKKEDKEKESIKEDLEIFAQNQRMSVREVKMYMDLQQHLHK
jgi:hypothetical protein